jgi:PIN domain nuclease of toxin-antitoxin system
MRLLLDTCAIIFFVQPTRDLTPAAVAAIAAPDSEVFVSAASAMELACLQARNRIKLAVHWRKWWQRAISLNGWACLPVTQMIAEEAYCLPEPIHRDPVDRLLIATARQEGLTLVTTDRLILGYPHVASLA